MTVLENPWIPDDIKAGLTPKQAAFLCFEGRDALFGGAAGGGKSVALLAAALQFVDVPRYSALILRRTYAQLAKADSVMSKSKDWLWGRKDLKGRACKWNGETKMWTFPSGATLEFGHMHHEDAIRDYQGGAWAYVGVDEATQFTEKMLNYPRSRQRRPAGSQLPVRWRGASNPGGVGHEFIKLRYVKDKQNQPIPGTPHRQFFPATIADNPNLDREEYIQQLRESGIDPLTLAQLLAGDWDAVAGGRFRREWLDGSRYRRRGDYYLLRRVGEATEYAVKLSECFVFGTCDPAASSKTSADYTVVSAWAITPRGDLIWVACDRFQAQIPDICPRLLAFYRTWRLKELGIEAIAANAGVYQTAMRLPMAVVPLNKGAVDKLVHATPAINLVATGRVWLPAPGEQPGFPLAEVESELTRFTGNDKEDDHDDICLAGETLVTTDRGDVPINTVRPGDKALTRLGFKTISAMRMTSPLTRVLRVSLADGRELVGTPAHKVFVNGRGFVRLDTLSYADCVLTWNHHAPKPLCSTASLTDATHAPRDGLTGFTFRPTPRIARLPGICTETSGSFTTGQFRTATKSTTQTAIHSTMIRRIWSALRSLSIAAVMRPAVPSTPRLFGRTLTAFAHWLQRGTGAKRDVFGTAKMGSELGHSASQPSACVTTAKRCSPRSPDKPNTARGHAHQPPAEPPALTTRPDIVLSARKRFVLIGTARFELAPVPVLSVQEGGKQPVFNLAVEDEHEYFAAGILTHNCDTLSYAAARYIEGGTPEERAQRPMIIGGAR